ncbi:MAG: YggS family pyridoxal phosphate-dependent enzyme [Bacteroides sp.]|nr:YggS family pyridoxal phosphate-dependent enzyme [Bacteroides sp.]
MTEKSFSNSGDDLSGQGGGAAAEKAVSSVPEEELVRIRDSFGRITENIEKAKLKAGRRDSVRLMAVTKTVPYEKVNYAVSLGIDLLGENRVQEFLGKFEFYDKKSEIHFIGGLQNNKVKYIIDKVSLIHSVDSVKLAEEISGRAEKLNKVMDILIEVNIGGEESKGGVSTDGLDELVSCCHALSGIRLRGFMAIPPPDRNGSSERYFEAMERLYGDYRSKYGNEIDTLSMGMSQDYEQAVLHGSNIVRVGSALFGKRK